MGASKSSFAKVANYRSAAGWLASGLVGHGQAVLPAQPLDFFGALEQVVELATMIELVDPVVNAYPRSKG